MSTFYFDSANGSDSTGTGTLANPWATYQAKFGANVFAGDTCYIKAGTTQAITTQFFAFRGGASAATPSRLLAYGVGAKPRFVYTGTAWGAMFDASNQSNVLIEGIDFDGTNTNSTLLLSAKTTVAVANWKFNFCDFHNAGSQQTGITVTKDGSATTATIGGIEFNYCNFYDNGSHGVVCIAVVGATFRHCVAYNNAALAASGGAHGFSSRWHRSDVTSGWTNTSGQIYSRVLTAAEAAENNIGYVQSPLTNRLRLTNAGATTTPGLDEYGVVAGTLYINIGQDPNGLTIRYAWARCASIVYEDCVAYNNKVNAGSTFQEGNGFAFDDFTEDSTLRRCISYSNEGRGFSVNRGDDNLIEDSVAWGNGLTGLSSNTSHGLTVKRSTFCNNSLGNPLASSVGGSVMYFSPQVTAAISESVLQGPSTDAYNVDDSVSTTITVDRCSLSGAAAQTRSLTPTNTVAGDPLLLPTGEILPGSPCLGAGTFTTYMRDVRKYQRPRPPGIGAYDAATLRVKP